MPGGVYAAVSLQQQPVSLTEFGSSLQESFLHTLHLFAHLQHTPTQTHTNSGRVVRYRAATTPTVRTCYRCCLSVRRISLVSRRSFVPSFCSFAASVCTHSHTGSAPWGKHTYNSRGTFFRPWSSIGKIIIIIILIQEFSTRGSLHSKRSMGPQLGGPYNDALILLSTLA